MSITFRETCAKQKPVQFFVFLSKFHSKLPKESGAQVTRNFFCPTLSGHRFPATTPFGHITLRVQDHTALALRVTCSTSHRLRWYPSRKKKLTERAARNILRMKAYRACSTSHSLNGSLQSLLYESLRVYYSPNGSLQSLLYES